MKRKIYVSYVIQANDNHSHHSEIIEIEAPYYKFSFAQNETTTNAVMRWKEEKTLSFNDNEKLVISSFFLL